MAMDELETFVLDFLAYRREQRMKERPPQSRLHVPKRIEYTPEVAPELERISPSIGRGWPHYKGTAHSTRRVQQHVQHGMVHQDAPPVSSSQSDIIPALAPVVAQALARFGPPTSQKTLDHLVNQVIASAMELPPVCESMQTAELRPWGRVALLQAVVELLIRISTM